MPMVGDVSIVTGKTKTFKTFDYVIFAAILVISASIGFYHAWVDRRNHTLKEFLLAGGNMQVLPVMLSLLASFMSAITLLGVPGEMYLFSTMYFYIGIGYLLVVAGAAHIYIPIFYRLNVTSAYDYLERRFGKAVRTIGSLTFVLQMTLYMAIVLYAPSLALNAVTGFTLWGAVVSVGSICAIYTALGGMKAVLWTDCFQVAMILSGLIAVLIRGSMETGGFAAAWKKMDESGRVILDDFSAAPNVRHSFWSLTAGAYFTWVAIYGVNQAMVQRACTCPTLRRAQIALWLNAPGLWLILYLGCMIGVVVYAFYSDCDPITNGLISSKDQLLPLFVMDVLGDIPGMPGLFVACLFSGALSTLSSGLNSIAAVMVEDIVKAFIVPGMSDKNATRATQVIALAFGFLCLLLTYVASLLGNVLQAALSLFGMLAGPLLGVFTLGMMFPWANTWGALSGLLSSLVVTLSMGIGAFIYKPPVLPTPPKLGVDNHCIFKLNWTTTVAPTTPAGVTTTKAPDIFPMFTVSYIYIGFYGLVTVVFVGLIVSAITGLNDPRTMDPRLICPIFDILPPFCFLPKNTRKRLWFGVRHDRRFSDDSEKLKVLESLAMRKWSEIVDQTIIVSEPVVPDDSYIMEERRQQQMYDESPPIASMSMVVLQKRLSQSSGISSVVDPLYLHSSRV